MWDTVSLFLIMLRTQDEHTARFKPMHVPLSHLTPLPVTPAFENFTPCQFWNCIPGVSCSYLLPSGLNNLSPLMSQVPSTKLPSCCHQCVCQKTMPKASVVPAAKLCKIFEDEMETLKLLMLCSALNNFGKQWFEVCLLFNLRASMMIYYFND